MTSLFFHLNERVQHQFLTIVNRDHRAEVQIFLMEEKIGRSDKSRSVSEVQYAAKNYPGSNSVSFSAYCGVLFLQ